jgi:hypothetical protein
LVLIENGMQYKYKGPRTEEELKTFALENYKNAEE